MLALLSMFIVSVAVSVERSVLQSALGGQFCNQRWAVRVAVSISVSVGRSLLRSVSILVLSHFVHKSSVSPRWWYAYLPFFDPWSSPGRIPPRCYFPHLHSYSTRRPIGHVGAGKLGIVTKWGKMLLRSDCRGAGDQIGDQNPEPRIGR